MGNEAQCVARLGKRKARGKALLETAEILFRSEDGAMRLKIPFANIQSAAAENGHLRLEVPEGTAIFELGAKAAKWREKIVHPKTRLEKLGVKAEEEICLLGEFGEDFRAELAASTRNVSAGKITGTPSQIFFAADAVKDLSQLARAAKELKGAAALWIVYPKGQKQITENEVIAAGRKCGLKDVKVVGFSPTHTALKFVIPLEKR